MALPTVTVVLSGDAVEVPEAILTLSSPVFRAMLGSGMREAQKRVIELPGKCKEEFEAFAKFLKPFSFISESVEGHNVDFLLQWSHEYDVAELKLLCERYLLTQPTSVARLLQAHRCQLSKQRQRCIEEVGQSFEAQEVEQVLREEPSLMAELLPEMERGKVQKAEELLRLKASFKRRLEELSERLYAFLPETKIEVEDGKKRRSDAWAKGHVNAVIAELC